MYKALLGHLCNSAVLCKHYTSNTSYIKTGSIGSLDASQLVVINASALLNQAEGFRHQESSILCQIDV